MNTSTHTQTGALGQDDIVHESQSFLRAITPGNWCWRGNTDHQGDVELSAFLPGAGRVLVMGTVPEVVTRAEAAREWERLGLGEFVSLDDYLDRLDHAEPTRRLAFSSDDHRMVTGRERAVYEVVRSQGLPDDTPRDHPQVYRGDVVGVRNANASFIAEAPRLVRSLSDEVIRLRQELAWSTYPEAFEPETPDCAAL